MPFFTWMLYFLNKIYTASGKKRVQVREFVQFCSCKCKLDNHNLNFPVVSTLIDGYTVA